MAKICGKNTKPELKVRRFIYSLGFRYRLHVKNIPGTPDLVFQSRKKIIFVHGCFWHHHEGCKKARLPKSNQEYWFKKIYKNVRRDEENIKQLTERGWEVLVVWECETKALDKIRQKIVGFLQ